MSLAIEHGSSNSEGTAFVHVVPGLPPNVNGVGDYAITLGAALRELAPDANRSAYISAGVRAQLPPLACLNAIDLLTVRDPLLLADAVTAQFAATPGLRVLLLHYVGYGYSRRGCPNWLLPAFPAIRRRLPDTIVITMFHELYATGWPHQSAFWLGPAQRLLARSIAVASDGAFTNRALSAHWLRARVGAAQLVAHAPVFSTVGEPISLPLPEERNAYAMLFGSATAKARIYIKFGNELASALHEIGIEKIVDAGEPGDRPRRLGDIPIESLQARDRSHISACMLRCSVGILHYPLQFFTKSTIGAAFFAHGLGTLVLEPGNQTPEIVRGREYFELADVGAAGSIQSIDDARRVGLRARKRYDEIARSAISAERVSQLVHDIHERQSGTVPS